MPTKPKPARPYILRGRQVGLKALHRDDAAVATPLFQNLEMLIHLTARGRFETVESELAWIDKALKNEEGEVHFSIFELKRDRYVGGCGLFRIQPMNCAILGITLADPAVWGRGYGTEATRLLVEYGMFFLNLYNIRLHVFAFNTRAVRAYEKAGFRPAGRIRGSIVVGGKRYDELVMDIIRDDIDPTPMQRLAGLAGGAGARGG